MAQRTTVWDCQGMTKQESQEIQKAASPLLADSCGFIQDNAGFFYRRRVSRPGTKWIELSRSLAKGYENSETLITRDPTRIAIPCLLRQTSKRIRLLCNLVT